MLDSQTKRKIDTARQILVGKVPDPKSQIEQITLALIYKFMNDTDKTSVEIGGKPSYFVDDYERFSWDNIIDPRLTGQERMNLYTEGLERMGRNPNLPELFRNIFKNAFLPFRSPETLNMFLEEINGFYYDHSERLGDAYEYLLSIMSSQGDAGQFRTPRHIIDFIVKVVDPQKTDSILDPACGTAGFLISAYKHIYSNNTKDIYGDLLDNEEKKKLADKVVGYEISPDMRRISLVNMFLHKINEPHIYEYDTLSSTDKWEEYFSCILANPPFMSPKGGINPHERFSQKSSRSEVLFVDYIMEHLTLDGKAGVIIPEGVIFQGQKAFAALRKKMVDDNFLWAVVSLPSGIFNPYSGVKTSILFFDREIAKRTDEILFVKIEADGYNLGAQRKPIENNDLPESLEALLYYKQHLKLPQEDHLTKANCTRELAHTAKKQDIADQDYNLSASRYIITEVRQGKWPRVKLGEVCEIIAGQSPESRFYNEIGEGLPFYQGKSNFGDIFLEKPSKWTIKVTKRSLPDDIVMSVRAPVGPVNLVTDEICIGRGLAAIRCSTSIDSFFCFYILRSFENKIKGNSGAVFPSISRTQIESIEIPLPPLAVQKEIVAEIEGYQKIIDGAKQVVENWKPKIDIDPEWQLVKLGEVCEINPDSGNPQKLFGNDLFTYIDISSIDPQTGSISFDNQMHPSDAPSRARRVIRKDDVIISTVRPNLKAFALVENLPKNVLVSTGFAVLRSNNLINPKFLYFIIISDYAVEQMIGQMDRGSYPSIKTDDIKSIKIPLPTIDEQLSIVNRIETEKNLVGSCKMIFGTFQNKIKVIINRTWKE
jgi:type I restriction enzyme M protein